MNEPSDLPGPASWWKVDDLHQNDQLQRDLRRYAGGIEAQNAPPQIAATLRVAADYIDQMESMLRQDGWARAGSNWLKNNRAG